MKLMLRMCLVPIAAALSMAPYAQAEPVSYAADFETSRQNPVTDILILERDAVGTVHGTIYPTDLPGAGLSVIWHDPPFKPVQSLVIGLTEGEDANGDDKTQLVMFVADAFAAANLGVKYSVAFPGARHSLTVVSLLAAIAGDATEMMWFTDTFFSGPAAAAVFETGESFSVAEFTSLTTIGNAVTAGDWVLNEVIQFLPSNDPNAQNGVLTAVVDETATSARPYDIQIELNGHGTFAMDKIVLNDSGRDWIGFILELGTGLGSGFVPSTANDGLGFTLPNITREETGAMPDEQFNEDDILFGGFLDNSGFANFVFFVQSNKIGTHTVTVRQTSLASDNIFVDGFENPPPIGNVAIFIDDTIFTIPTGVNLINIAVWGGGGGGAGGATFYGGLGCPDNFCQGGFSGNGGGAGGLGIVIGLAVNEGDSFEAVVGHGGARGIRDEPGDAGMDSVLIQNEIEMLRASGGRGGKWIFCGPGGSCETTTTGGDGNFANGTPGQPGVLCVEPPPPDQAVEDGGIGGTGLVYEIFQPPASAGTGGVGGPILCIDPFPAMCAPVPGINECSGGNPGNKGQHGQIIVWWD